MAQTTTGPSYYQRGSIQVWDFIRDKGLSFHLGNAVKYICRYGHKGDYNDQLSDLNKAIHYLENERDHLQRSRNREDLSGQSYDTVVFTGTGVPGGLSVDEFKPAPSPFSAKELDYGGVQGILGGGGENISF